MAMGYEHPFLSTPEPHELSIYVTVGKEHPVTPRNTLFHWIYPLSTAKKSTYPLVYFLRHSSTKGSTHIIHPTTFHLVTSTRQIIHPRAIAAHKARDIYKGHSPRQTSKKYPKGVAYEHTLKPSRIRALTIEGALQTTKTPYCLGIRRDSPLSCKP